MTLRGKTAIVTGASRGIGYHIAKRLCADGGRVFAVARTRGDTVRVRELTEAGECTFFVCDLSRPGEAERVVPKCLEVYGRVDIVCNNAAIQGERLWVHEDHVANWQRVLQVNLISPFQICRAAIRDMLGRGTGGRIVNITSIQATMPLPAHGAYAASKGGLASFTKSLAVEYAARGIVANAIEVGVVASEGMIEFMARTGRGEASAPVGAATLNGRFGSPEEIAELVRFLVTDANTHLVGAVIRADGGRTISRLPDPY